MGRGVTWTGLRARPGTPGDPRARSGSAGSSLRASMRPPRPSAFAAKRCREPPCTSSRAPSRPAQLRRAQRHRGAGPTACCSTSACRSPALDDASAASASRPTAPRHAQDPGSGESAAELAGAGPPSARSPRVLSDFGEERFAKRIARAIVQARTVSPLRTTAELAALVARRPARDPHKHPATATFQAIRISSTASSRRSGSASSSRCAGWRAGRAWSHQLPLARGPHRQALHAQSPRGEVLPKACRCRACRRRRLRLIGKASRAVADEIARTAGRSAVLRVAERAA